MRMEAQASYSIFPAAMCRRCRRARSVPAQPVPFVDGLPRPEPFGQVTPLNARPHPVRNPIGHLPVIPPPATTPVGNPDPYYSVTKGVYPTGTSLA